MFEIASRRRPLFLLMTVITAQVLLLAYQIRRPKDLNDPRDVRLIRLWSVELLAPFERAGTWVLRGSSGAWRNYIGLRHTREENERLQRQVDDLQLRNRALESRMAEGERLAALWNFHESHRDAPMIAAQVIGSSAESSSHTLLINRGGKDHLRKDMAVITPDGVVGKVVEVYPNASQVRLITDRDSGVGALFADSRTLGIILGTGDPLVKLENIVNDEKVKPGDLIVTSGLDRIFPKDLPIGTVVEAKSGNPFQSIKVRPAARLDRLEEVLILPSLQEINMKKEAAVEGAQAEGSGTAASSALNPPAAGPAAPVPKPPHD